MNPSVLACTPQMAFYHWSEKGGIGEPLLFALWIISGNTGHTEVFSTYTMRCPHISAIFSLWNFPASPFLGPSLMPWRRHPSKALRATLPLPALPGDTPASELEARAVPDLWGTPVCLQVEEVMLSASRDAALCALHPHPGLLLERSSHLELLELLELLLAPFWGNLMLTLADGNDTSSADGPCWFSSEKLEFVLRRSTVLWI